MNADGTNQQNLTNNPADDQSPTWSPDGGRIAFYSNRTGWLEVYVMSADGSALVRLTNTRPTNTAFSGPLTWGPDGQHLLALRGVPWTTTRSTQPLTLDLIAADGSGIQTLYENTTGAPFSQPQLSPDGRYIAVIAQNETGYGVQISFIEQNPLQFNIARRGCFTFSWLPSNQELVCYSTGQLVALNLDGSSSRVFFENINYPIRFAWSPNQQYFLYVTQGFALDSGVGDYSLTLARTDGAGVPRTLVTTGLADPPDPSWSPDSQWAAYVSDSDGQSNIYITNIYNNSRVQRLTNELGDNYAPRWRPVP